MIDDKKICEMALDFNDKYLKKCSSPSEIMLFLAVINHAANEVITEYVRRH